jgi:geranylgeranyl diphosphate synthase, type II
MANKKTFLMIHALETTTPARQEELKMLMRENPADKVPRVLEIFRETGIEQWALALKDQYLSVAFQHLEDIAVVSSRKQPLMRLAQYLVQRDK